MTVMRDTIEIMGAGCQILVNQQQASVVFAVESWNDVGEERHWARLELAPDDAERLGRFLRVRAGKARDVQLEIAGWHEEEPVAAEGSGP
jgi:hypothetical protein